MQMLKIFIFVFISEHLTVESYINGIPDLGITPGANLEQLVSMDTFPQTNSTTDIYLFPGKDFCQ